MSQAEALTWRWSGKTCTHPLSAPPMPRSFWIKRFLTVVSGVFLVLLAVGQLKDRPGRQAVTESAGWAGISSTIFLATRVYYSRRGQPCELCGDTPGTPKGQACELKDPKSRP
jgi:hypothetical protein